MTKEFGRAAWLQYVCDGYDYYEPPTIDAQLQLLNSRQSLVRSVCNKLNANVATDASKSRIDAVLDVDDH